MTTYDKAQIHELFQQLQQMAIASPPRDPQAEATVRERIERQPTAPYYMTQLLLLQKQSLATARQQIDALERQLAQEGRGPVARDDEDDPISTGLSFLTGAAQAALAVGGGLLLADFVVDAVDALFGSEADLTADAVGSVEESESWI